MIQAIRKKLPKVLMLLGVLLSFHTSLVPLFTHIEVQAQNQNGTVELDRSQIVYTTVDWRGESRRVKITRIYLNGELVFCADPFTFVIEGDGYTSQPFTLSRRINLIASLWDLAGNDFYTYVAAQMLIWEDLGASMSVIEGMDLEQLNNAKSRINNVLNQYIINPSFHQQTITATIGQSYTLTDTNNSDLSRFTAIGGTAQNLPFSINGDNLTVTPNENSTAGTLLFESDYRTGTAFLWVRPGSQDLISSGIEDPVFFEITVNIHRTGALEILKTDEENGAVVPNTRFRVEYTNANGNASTREVTTNAQGIARMDGVLHGTRPRIIETFVPAPFILDPLPFYANVPAVAGDTVFAQQENRRQRGQVRVQKTGERSGTTMWNPNYSLAGNLMAIRRGSPTGPIVETILTDANGRGETTNIWANATIGLGVYYVTENQASPGFARTWTPQRVEIEYAGQTVEVAQSEVVEGTNREITGDVTLTKVDRDLGTTDTQGNATHEGAEFTLFHYETGAPVLWTRPSEPQLVYGTHSTNPYAENAISVRISENNQIRISSLELGRYFWLETRAPFGYTRNQNRIDFEITEIDDETEVVVLDMEAYNQVIRFGFSFFKYLSGASATTNAGANGIEFRLTPLDDTLEITGASDTAVTSNHPLLGWSGYGRFENIPIGNYLLEEVEESTPEGYDPINPLYINVRFEEAENRAESLYIFTVTEVGSTQPILTQMASYGELTNANFHVGLGSLNFFNLPMRPNELTSLQTWENGENVISPNGTQTAIDRVFFNLAETSDNWHLISFLVDVEASQEALDEDEDADLVLIGEPRAMTMGNTERRGYWDIPQEVATEEIIGRDIVRMNYLFEDEQAYLNGEAPIAVDNNLHNLAQTIRVEAEVETPTTEPKLDRYVRLATQAHTGDGSTQTFTWGDLIDAHDRIYITNSQSNIGENQVMYAFLHVLLPKGYDTWEWNGRELTWGDVIFQDRIEYEVEYEQMVRHAVTELETGEFPFGTEFHWSERVYNEGRELLYMHNPEFDQPTQSLRPLDKEEPEYKGSAPAPTPPSAPTPTVAPRFLPATGGTASIVLRSIGITLMFASGGYMVWRKKRSPKVSAYERYRMSQAG